MGSTIKDFYSGIVLATLLALASCDRGVEQATVDGPAVTTTVPAAQTSDDRQYASRENDSADNAGGEERGSRWWFPESR